MDTNYPAALGAGPPFLFFLKEIPYAELSDVFEVVNHAHSVLCLIAIIQVVQYTTRKAVTTEAILDSTFRNFLTVLDFACDAGLRFLTVFTPAAGAGVPFPHIGTAQAAVHSTGRNQCCSDFAGQPFCRHFRL